jgi:hypothetical protein
VRRAEGQEAADGIELRTYQRRGRCPAVGRKASSEMQGRTMADGRIAVRRETGTATVSHEIL